MVFAAGWQADDALDSAMLADAELTNPVSTTAVLARVMSTPAKAGLGPFAAAVVLATEVLDAARLPVMVVLASGRTVRPPAADGHGICAMASLLRCCNSIAFAWPMNT
jgi:Mg-chelatase subunit ChlD